MNASAMKHPRFRIFSLGAAIAVLAPFLAAIPQQSAAADPPPVEPAAISSAATATVDGLSEATAAASCWEIKQNNSDAEDGVYWLWTPDLGAPDQFYCDQTTDGGGWVLIGRGREGWSESTMGSGTSAQVRSPITGTAAFTPRQLPSRTIEALLNGQSVNSLPDGIRLHRALNQQGTSWQDLTFTLASPRDTWTWQFYNNQRVDQWTVDGVTRSGGETSNFGSNNTYRRVTTVAGSAQGWMAGFGYGTSARGNPSASSYIWGNTTSMVNPRPFTQVFLRPQLTSEDVALPVPVNRTDEIVLAPGAQSFAERTAWGVAGLGNGPQSVEGSNEVSAFAEVNGVVFVGGNYTTVQTSSGGANQHNQAYLAAFDVDTGEWISTFRPTLNNQIKAIAAMPDGRIAIGGFFTTVNGQPRQGLAVLDAHTGELDPDFTGSLVNYLGNGSSVIVRSLDVQDGWLYVGGAFTHGTGGTETREVYMRSAGRFSVTNGTPSAGWNPEFNGTVISLDASARGDRVYYAGYFSQSQTSPTMRGAAILTSNAEALTWNVHLSSSERAGYQQAVKEVGDRVWLGGSEHSLFSYSRDNFGLLSTVIGQRGGDFQAIASDGVTVYGGCHCFDAMYTGADQWPNVGNSWTAADRINSAGAWSAETATLDPEFSPDLNMRNGAGAWALFVDSTGTLWEGGDFSYSLAAGYTRQWSGGFVRFAPRDTSAPATPTDLDGGAAGEGVNLTWKPVEDAVSYDVLNSGRVIASTTQPGAHVPIVSDDTTYAVRAVDGAGNRSSSTAPLTIEPPVPGPQDATFVAAGSTWSYLYTNAGPTGAWNDPEFDDSSWQSGAAPIGWGHGALGTTLSSAETLKPITSFYRIAFDVVDATVVESVLLSTRADDGIIVYVNGTEVVRENVEAGLSGSGVYAEQPVSASQAMANPVIATVSGNLFVTGENVIAVEVHSNYRNTPSHSFDLSALATFGTQPPPNEPDPGDGDEPSDPDGGDPGVVVEGGSTWSYYYGGDAVMAEWESPATDVSSWSSGVAPLGWGQAQLGTVLSTEASPKPITSYYRTTFTLPQDATGGVEFTTRADDGIVVYVNGVERARENLASGPVTAGLYATNAVSASAALNNPVVFTVPVADLEAGENVIAVEVHSNYRNTPSHSFDLSAALDPDFVPPAEAPAADVADTDDLVSEDAPTASDRTAPQDGAPIENNEEVEASESTMDETSEAPASEAESADTEDAERQLGGESMETPPTDTE